MFKVGEVLNFGEDFKCIYVYLLKIREKKNII